VSDLADIIAAAFMAGVKEEAKRQAKALGKEVIRELPSALLDTSLLIEDAMRATESKARKIKKTKRKPSKYNLAYAKAFAKEAPRFKKKNGGWKKDGFKNAGAAARRSMK